MSREEITRGLEKRLKWWQTSFEGPDGRANGNLLTVFAVVSMGIVTWAANLFWGIPISDNLLYLLCGLFIVAIFAGGFVTYGMVKAGLMALSGQPYITDMTNINIQNKQPSGEGRIDNVDG